MSKDNNNLRLLGSPVNLSYRIKKKDDKKNIRNRPRSALQNSCFTPDLQEGYKRPFSADAKERAPSTRNFLKAFSAELLQSYNNTPNVVKIVAPTTELLGASKSSDKQYSRRDKDIPHDNISDYGSEDTFISLGTKIKAKAQSAPKSPKAKSSNQKNFLKYRNISKRGRKSMETNVNEDKSNNYGFEIKITERPQSSPSPLKNESSQDRSSPLPFRSKPYESYFVALNDCKKVDEDALAGRVSFGTNNIHSEVDNLIDKYSRRLNLTKQQLSLVEEESTQDLESIRSQNLNSLSQENELEDDKKGQDVVNETDRNTSMLEPKDDKKYSKLTQNFIDDTRTYKSFYDDFRSNPIDGYRTKHSSTVVHTDSSSKDSGYPDSGPNDDKPYKRDYSLPTSSIMKKSYSHNKIDDQPKSLDSTSSSGNDKSYNKTFPFDKKYSESLNHSRLLYKDFFLKKEGDSPLPPNNSPIKHEVESIPGTNDNLTKADDEKNNLEYPSYLLNSSTKAYTSKVIEDYKKELEAINCLHELTLKDIKTDAVSPTPLNIDKMFEQNSVHFSEITVDSKKNSEGTSSGSEKSNKSNKTVDSKKDVSEMSTKEIIQNYLKVKEGDYGSEYLNKALKKYEKKGNIANDQAWNNKSKVTSTKVNLPNTIRNQTSKSLFTMRTPLSARIEGVQNDRDIDSWMSLSAPSPRILELDSNSNLDIQEKDPTSSVETKEQTSEEINAVKNENTSQASSPSCPTDNEVPRTTELHEKATVLDIYSMSKEIESFGERPVTSVSQVVSDTVPDAKQPVPEDRASTPKDNFMEIFEFLEKVEQSANDALSVVTNTTPPTVPKLDVLLKLSHTELAQRLVTASLQLEERSCCIALLQESLANHKEQMINKVSNLEKQSLRNVSKVKKECEEAIKRHQSFIDQLINDKKTLNHRIEQLVDERRVLEDRWKRSAQTLEERYKLELRNQHDKMATAHQLSRQRWVKQKAEKIKELTVKGLEGELREMADRQQKEIADLKMSHAEQSGRIQAKHAQEMEELRRSLEEEKEAALIKERQVASSRLEKQILELELSFQQQRTRLVADMRAENERVASGLGLRDKQLRENIEKWREEQEKLLEEKRVNMESEIAKERDNIEQQLNEKRKVLEAEFEKYKKEFEGEQQMLLKKRTVEITAQHRVERDREIEKAIESMEAEAQAGRRELQEALKRNKEQYEIELKELGETEQATLRRYQDAQNRIRHTEDRCAELEVMVSQLETRNRVLTEKNSQLEQRADEVRSSCEETWKGKLENMKKEMEDMKRTHEEQMHQLYAKVKVAVARKDSAIQALTREAGKYQEKITLLEQKLQQQRKDFLGKNNK